MRIFSMTIILFVTTLITCTSFADNVAATINAPVTGSEKPGQLSAKMAPKDFISALKVAGITYDVSGNMITIIVDQQVALAGIPTLQSVGAIDPTLVQLDINSHSITYSGTVALYYTAEILPYVYKNSNIGMMHIYVYLLSPDVYGNKQKHLIFSFDFNRDIYKKINWSNFPAPNLEKVTYNFRFDPWYSAQLKKE